MPETLRKIKGVLRKSPFLYSTLKPVARLLSTSEDLEFTESGEYWEQRYLANGDSGDGSYGRLAKFKSEVINEFVSDNSILSVIEFGCGDGAQLNRMKYDSYIGVDVSDAIVQHCTAKFANDVSKQFLTCQSYERECVSLDKSDLSISLDVIYHLVEDDVFDNYMRTLFAASSRWVIVYSSNEEMEFQYEHVRHRVFTDWIDSNASEWSLHKKIPQKFAYDAANASTTSFADFYIFKKNL